MFLPFFSYVFLGIRSCMSMIALPFFFMSVISLDKLLVYYFYFFFVSFTLSNSRRLSIERFDSVRAFISSMSVAHTLSPEPKRNEPNEGKKKLINFSFS